MTEQEVKSFIKALAHQEAAISSGRTRSGEESEQTVADVSYQRRVLRGKLDIARAEFLTRLRGDDDDGGPGSQQESASHGLGARIATLAACSCPRRGLMT